MYLTEIHRSYSNTEKVILRRFASPPLVSCLVRQNLPSSNLSSYNIILEGPRLSTTPPGKIIFKTERILDQFRTYVPRYSVGCLLKYWETRSFIRPQFTLFSVIYVSTNGDFLRIVPTVMASAKWQTKPTWESWLFLWMVKTTLYCFIERCLL